ncbi:MAG: DUF362 domain-containing protein [Candidatus Heimdallarchaeota archaeon]|nr:DUF362 domain-containing protein [Candidatus Heimdallarchaeota archaeon]
MKDHSVDSAKKNVELHKHLEFGYNKPIWKKIRESAVIFGILNLVWFLFRTGKKPTRITYPCQQIALTNVSASASSLLTTISLSVIFVKMRKFSSIGKIAALALLILSPVTSVIILQTTAADNEISFPINPQLAAVEPSSDIFIVNGREEAHIDNLLNMMGDNGLDFYESILVDNNTSPDGLISSSDVVLIKNNCQWDERGGTNTDLIKELIQAIINHPDGFTGEIVIADNGQGRGSMNWGNNNAEDKSQSVQDVVNQFSSVYQVSAYLWDDIRSDQVSEFSEGNMVDGYVVNSTADAETEINVSYPKFTTTYGTKISFKHGIWNGTHYEERLKIINMPILKSHSSFGVTAAMKHYMGVQSQPLTDGHNKIDTGGMATLMVELGLPTLNILDAIWINAHPETSSAEGPGTDYDEATRVNMILASLDPIALDYWAAKNILLNASKLSGYSDPYSLDPDSTNSDGLSEAFGIWLNNSLEEFVREGYVFTIIETHMNIYTNSEVLDIEVLVTELSRYFSLSLVVSALILTAVVTTVVLNKKRDAKIQK